MKTFHLFAVLVTLPLLLGGCGGKAVAETAPELEGINFDKLEEREGVHYLKGSNKPYKGKVFRLYKNGQKKIEANMKDGKPDGLTFGWHENGKKMQEVKWNEGKAEGSATWWYESGQKKLSGTFKEGKRHGLWTWWDEGGQKKSEISFIQGKAEEGSDVLWDGQVIRYKAKVKPEEPLAETKPELEGVVFKELEYREGIAYLKGSDTPYTGKSFLLYKNGQKKSEGNFKDGKLVGLVVEWHENGQKWRELNYKDGKVDGLYVEWYENGQKKCEINYEDDGIGSEKFWNSKGEPVDSLEEARK